MHAYRTPLLAASRSLAAAVFVLALTRPARAGDRDNAVVTVTAPERAGTAEKVARSVRRALDGVGSPALGGGALVERLKAHVRSSPSVAPDVGAVLARERDSVLDAVAFGRDEEAIASGDAVLEREWPVLSTVNGLDAAARDLGDICLFLVRAELHRGGASAARQRARECLRLVPDIEPSASVHPPEVRAVLGQARDTMTGRLRVRASSGDAVGCVARVQGRLVVPWSKAVALVAGNYVVEVECAGKRFLHEARVEEGLTSDLVVHAELERELGLEPAIALRRPELRALGQLGDWVAIEELWTVEGAGSEFTITRYSRRGSALAALGKRTVHDAAPEVEHAVHELACLDVPCGRVAARAGGTRTLGLIAGGVGVASIGASWIAYSRFRAADDELTSLPYDDARHGDAVTEHDRWRTVSLVTSVSGSALFAATAPLWLPERRSVPWWAWSAGAAGVVVAGAGAATWLGDGGRESVACPPADVECFRYRSSVPLAPLLVSQGVALLALPGTYALRELLHTSSGTLELAVTSGRVNVGWNQRFGL